MSEEQEKQVEIISISFDEKEINEVGSLDAVTNQITKFCKASFQEVVNSANDLILKQQKIVVGKDDKKSYDEAKELYSKHKTLWVKIDKDTDIIKKNIKPILEKVQTISDDIYNPLQESGKKLKNKMLVYEVEQERKKQEKRDKELAEQKRKEEIATKLLSLNTDYLVKIQNAQTIEEIDSIKADLMSFDVSIFEEQSANATFQITQLNMTCDMMRSNISMKIEQEKFRKQEEERLAEQKRKEDEELKANQERIAQKLKEEEEEREIKRKAELEALAKIKQEEEKLNATKIEKDFSTEKITETSIPTPICPTSKIDVEEDEKQSLSDNVIFAESIARQPFVKEEQVKTPAYNEMLKELFEREILWFVQNNAVVTEEQLAITLASIVEKQKHIIF